MQTLLDYKFKYEFVKGALNILPDLLSHNPAMCLVRGNKDPQVTVILESLILLAPGPPPPSNPSHGSSCYSPAPGHWACPLIGGSSTTCSPQHALV
ncbi:hypothetical protein DSO57_1006999 [Entomophthora muscae]|uniref:Uncharacterized protein n=1 Tax=Entomophthora muscae TaxID=34485 RepID=A0ACC2USY1_9FUNG|nr:hypothetical protein DSO57_1006999 [Entomophthora muscae]